jgi:3-carboxy-cis,cis-muconate cycloisomerase
MSSIFEGFLATSEVAQAFSERNFLQAMLRYEAALARAQAGVGLIPQAAAQSIMGTCKVELFDVDKIVRESARAGSIATPLLKSLKETVGLFNQQAAAFVHFGATDQDLMDSALALVTREALDLIQAEVQLAVAALLALAQRHADCPMLARMSMQPASVMSFGQACAGWAAPLLRSLQRLQASAGQALSVQLGGTGATPAPLKKNRKDAAPQLLALMAAELRLVAPSPGGPTQRDEWVALGCELGLLVGSLGKMARDIALLGRHEIAELAEAPGCRVALAAAQRAPQRVAALLAAMAQEHERAPGDWQAELAEWPGLLMAAHASARAMAQALPGLQVDTGRMRANLAALKPVT